LLIPIDIRHHPNRLATISDQTGFENVRLKEGEAQCVGRKERLLPLAVGDNLMRAWTILFWR
jgi:hypothetical protein